ncbi:erythronate-4-phosphate dehydrogenase [Gammaproteobacteria bacterium]|nr:erythronate-4-phosphate dehydrogenase [Gammaproteobacteria bacterium]
MIKIAADSQIPNLESRLSELFDVEYSLQYFESDQLKSNDLKDIDALFVRSTVQVDQELCNNSQIQFVGSATAGINHLDTKYLNDQDIAWGHAPGCNAASVTHYVMAAIGELIQEGLFNVRQSVGIVGYGNIGKRLYQMLSALNIPVYAHDPFLTDSFLVEIDKILACDLITIHVPYSTEGDHPTRELINISHAKDLKDKILINTSRGGVVSEALVMESQDLIYIADVWLNEPAPSPAVIQKAFIATPHIAGYSIEGKLNGTSIIAMECARVFKCIKETSSLENHSTEWPHGLENIVRDMHAFGFPLALFKSELDLRSISDTLKNISVNELADRFKDLRVHHSPRHDLNAYSYQEIVDLDESINLTFFNSLKNL